MALKYVLPLTEEQRKSLNKFMEQSKNAREIVRCNAILMSSKNICINIISMIYDVDRDTVSRWLNWWNAYGIEGLKDDFHSGRKPKLTKLQQIQVVQIVKEEPRKIKLAVGKIKEKFDKDLSIKTIKRILLKKKLRWKRVRRSIKSKRNQKEFEEFKKYKELLHLWEKSGLIDVKYFDETGFNLIPAIPYSWQENGDIIEIPSSSSTTLSVLGFMDKSCNFHGYTVKGTVNADVAISCFNDFCQTITKNTVVILDNSPVHTSKAFKAEIENWKEKKLFIKYLPKYSPELNDIEILWRFAKYEWMPFDAYQTKEKLVDNVEQIIQKIGTDYIINFK